MPRSRAQQKFEARQKRETRCRELSRRHDEVRKESELYLGEYYRENDKAEALFERADSAISETTAARYWTEWDQQKARANVAWSRHTTAHKEARKLIKKWSQLCKPDWLTTTGGGREVVR